MAPAPSVEVVAYDACWPSRAAVAIAELQEAMAHLLRDVEHIGSTAVPGLAAKPIIDLMASARDLGPVEADEKPLVNLGYRRHLNGMTDRLLYVRMTDDRRTHILHVVTAESWPTRNQRILRDYLRRHPQDAARYAELKRWIAAAGVRPGEYAQAKTGLLQELTDRARAQLGLPSVQVWEKRSAPGAGDAG